MTKHNRTHYTIGLDALRDLYEAGNESGADAAEAFFTAYSEAAQEYAEEHGLTIDVVRCRYDGPNDGDYETDEEAIEVWQAIHSRTSVPAKEDAE